MSNETARLQMSLLQPAQAQKHVTVNEALMRLDGLVNMVLQSTSVAIPPEVEVSIPDCRGVSRSRPVSISVSAPRLVEISPIPNY